MWLQPLSSALELHHKNAAQKDFSFGSIIANPKAWSKLVTELQKCVLVCANCHRELHAGLAIVPNTAAVFNKSFSVYKTTEPQDKCPRCGTMKPARQRYCSVTCSGKARRKVDWDNIDLDGLIKAGTSVLQIAKQYGVWENAVRRQIITRKNRM